MTFDAKVYRVLISSPSDVTEERIVITEVIQSWNNAHSFNLKAVILPVLWETHATPEMGDSPQEIINKQIVKDCDVLIGVFWTRIGTPTEKAESGSVEEIQEFIRVGKPVLLYFSSAPVVLKSVDQQQYNRLEQFKDQCKKQGIIFEYKSVSELRGLIDRHLVSTISRIHASVDEDPQQTQASQVDPIQSALKSYKENFSSFLRTLEYNWKIERDSDPPNTIKGKAIMDFALTSVSSFNIQILNSDETDITQKLEEASTRLIKLQRHSTFMDGGKSFNAFWKEGDDVLELLRHVVELLDRKTHELIQKSDIDISKFTCLLDDLPEIKKVPFHNDISRDWRGRLENCLYQLPKHPIDFVEKYSVIPWNTNREETDKQRDLYLESCDSAGALLRQIIDYFGGDAG